MVHFEIGVWAGIGPEGAVWPFVGGLCGLGYNLENVDNRVVKWTLVF